MRNPVAGLIVCGVCGKHMTRRPMPKQPDFLLCTGKHCSNIGAYLSFIEEDVLAGIGLLIRDYKLDVTRTADNKKSDADPIKKSIARLENEISGINTQIDTLRDLLEKNVYTVEVYMERLQKLNVRKEEVAGNLSRLCVELASHSNHNKKILIPRLENIIEVYSSLDDPAERNALLKKSIESITYNKATRGGKDMQSQRCYTLKINPLFFNAD